MSKRRNSWDIMRRQSRVSESANPAFMLKPSLMLPDNVIGADGTGKVRPTENTAYIALEKRITGSLKISVEELRNRITKNFDVSPCLLEKLIAGESESGLSMANPWVGHIVKINEFSSERRVLNALLSEAERRQLFIIEERKANPDKFSEHGRIEL